MKKLVLLGLVLVSAGTGCGHGWLPFRGAMCRNNCVGSAPAYNGCDDCATGQAGYESYQGEQGGYDMGATGTAPYYPPNVTPQPNTMPIQPGR
jgi:hypothetical protein